MSFGSFIVVCMSLGIMIFSIIYGLAISRERLQSIVVRQDSESSLAATRRFRSELKAQRSSSRDAFWATIGDLIEAIAFGLFGFCMFVLALYLLTLALPTTKVLAFVLGLSCFGGAWWLWRHYKSLRATWRSRARPPRATEGGHGGAVLLHIAGIALLPIAGVLLLLSVL